MQLYALDSQQRAVFAKNAAKHRDYFCLECRSSVRLRGGLHRQNHFYHTQPNRACRLSGKSMVHIQVQCFIQKLIPDGEGFLERRFPEIDRIADVVWLPQKIIFEVQCSPITAAEVEARNRDYQSLGYQVVWILHDSRYNQWRMTAAELALRNSPHYFTDMDFEGRGYIYDQLDLIHKGLRKRVLKPLPVKLENPLKSKPLQMGHLPKALQARITYWPLYFSGDWVDSSQSALCADKIDEMLKLELDQSLHLTSPRSLIGAVKRGLYQFIVRPYQLIFQILLERACR